MITWHQCRHVFLFMYTPFTGGKKTVNMLLRSLVGIIVSPNTDSCHPIMLFHVSITSPRSRAHPRALLATASSPTARAARGSTTMASNSQPLSPSLSLRCHSSTEDSGELLDDEWKKVFMPCDLCFISCIVSCFDLCLWVISSFQCAFDFYTT